MLSRIADSLFWLNRYMVRSDGLLRTTRTNYILLLDKGINEHLTWQYVLEIFTHTPAEERVSLQYDTGEVLHRLLTDDKNINSLKALLTKARENARSIQDHITKEVWEQVNQMYHLVNQPYLESRLRSQAALDTVDSFLSQSTLYAGVINSTMPRTLGWCFMNLGQYIERALLTIEMTQKFLGFIYYDLKDEKNILQWRPMLLSLSGYELHLKTYRNHNYNENALHQVLFNTEFTRSVLYCLSRIDKYLKEVLEQNQAEEKHTLLRRFGRLYSKVQFTELDTLNTVTLHQFFNEIRTELNEFSTQLGQILFSYA